MKVRGTTMGMRLTALCWGALTLLAPVALAACTSSGTTTPTVFSPSVTTSASGSVTASASSGNSGRTPSPGSTATSGTPRVSSGSPGTVTPTPTRTVTPAPTRTVTPRATRTVTPTPAVTVTSSARPVPTAAPVTGGGGTAGFQDALLLGAGLAAIVAGAGSIFYRRRLNRGR